MSQRIAILFERFTIQVSNLLNYEGGLLYKIYLLRSFWDFPSLCITGGYYFIHHEHNVIINFLRTLSS